MNDIQSKEDIKVFIDSFYDKVREDKILSTIFNSKIKVDQWPSHLERMYSFWNTILFHEKDYRGQPFSKHMTLPIDKKHFNRWLDLLTTTIQQNFKGKKAEEVLKRAGMMSIMFQAKLEHIRTHKNYKPIS